jgi:hypothetical protein
VKIIHVFVVKQIDCPGAGTTLHWLPQQEQPIDVEIIMRISLAFGSAGSASRVPSVQPSRQHRRHRRIGDRLIPGMPQDVGLEALGQVLAEPGGFVGRSDAGGANDAPREVSSGANWRVRAGSAARHGGARSRAGATIAGSFEAAIVIALLVGGSAFAGYPLVHAAAESASVHATTQPANAQVTETILPGGARAVVETTVRRGEPIPPA